MGVSLAFGLAGAAGRPGPAGRGRRGRCRRRGGRRRRAGAMAAVVSGRASLLASFMVSFWAASGFIAARIGARSSGFHVLGHRDQDIVGQGVEDRAASLGFMRRNRSSPAPRSAFPGRRRAGPAGRRSGSAESFSWAILASTRLSVAASILASVWICGLARIQWRRGAWTRLVSTSTSAALAIWPSLPAKSWLTALRRGRHGVGGRARFPARKRHARGRRPSAPEARRTPAHAGQQAQDSAICS